MPPKKISKKKPEYIDTRELPSVWLARKEREREIEREKREREGQTATTKLGKGKYSKGGLSWDDVWEGTKKYALPTLGALATLSVADSLHDEFTGRERENKVPKRFTGNGFNEFASIRNKLMKKYPNVPLKEILKKASEIYHSR